MSGADLHINITSMYAARARAPFVVLTFSGQQEARADLPVAMAREIALWLLEAAEAAETDALAFEIFGKEQEQEGVQFLRYLRESRSERRGMEHPPINVEGGPS